MVQHLGMIGILQQPALSSIVAIALLPTSLIRISRAYPTDVDIDQDWPHRVNFTLGQRG